MRFRDRKAETVRMASNVCVMISLAAVFTQIWTMISGVESFLQGDYQTLFASLVLSGIALALCGFSAWVTTLDLF